MNFFVPVMFKKRNHKPNNAGRKNCSQMTGELLASVVANLDLGMHQVDVS